VVAQGRGRLKRNGQAVRRSEDFVGALLVTVLSPDDVWIVKGGPQARRELLDAVIISLSPKYERTLSDLERALRQRNALLRAASAGLRPGMADLLDVWDAKLAEVGEAAATAREGLVHVLQPQVGSAYEGLGGRETAELCYERSWEGGLLEALKDCRQSDLQRGVTGAGPQRDDLRLTIGGLVARSQASQGQQRSLALALRLGAHALVAEHQGTSPVLLLDDVFSELDPERSAALASRLRGGQALLTAAGTFPAALPVAAAFEVSGGSLRPVARAAGGA
jgi:DNA replication and repair protein RecF